jgi:uncharacterized protein (DUF1330 family)
MAAYIIGDVEITDPAAYEVYKDQVPAAIAAYGGRYLARGGAAELLEGGPAPRRQVVLEFPDMASLRAFYDSPEYRPLRDLRQRASTGRLVAVEGVPPA